MAVKLKITKDIKQNIKWLAFAGVISLGLFSFLSMQSNNNPESRNQPSNVLSQTDDSDREIGAVAPQNDPNNAPVAEPQPNTTTSPAPTRRVAARPSTGSVSPTCTDRVVFYKTVYVEVEWLEKGQTQEGQGVNGVERVCNTSNTGESTVSTQSSPVDKTVYVGTRINVTTMPIVPGSPHAPQNDKQAEIYCRSVVDVQADPQALSTCIRDYQNANR